jgi:hypothetical protein
VVDVVTVGLKPPVAGAVSVELDEDDGKALPAKLNPPVGAVGGLKPTLPLLLDDSPFTAAFGFDPSGRHPSCPIASSRCFEYCSDSAGRTTERSRNGSSSTDLPRKDRMD